MILARQEFDIVLDEIPFMDELLGRRDLYRLSIPETPDGSETPIAARSISIPIAIPCKKTAKAQKPSWKRADAFPRKRPIASPVTAAWCTGWRIKPGCGGGTGI